MGKNYSEEFKRQAVQLVLDGRTARSAANELGVSYWEIRQWKKKYPEGTGVSTSAMISDEEVKRMRRELQDLRMENAILKKYAAILSKEQLAGNSRS